jgi:preprotein translocase subunit SecG
MRTFLYTLHIVTCLSLVVVVLIQRGKGADMGAMLGGGGSQTVFGARGAGNFLTKITTSAAILFMVTSLGLSYFATQDSKSTIFDDSAIEEPAPAAGGPDESASPGAGLLEEIEDGSAGQLEEIPSDTTSPPEPAPATP